MTQWSDEPPAGSGATGPPAHQYGPPVEQYRQAYPPSAGYGGYGGYGQPGSPYGPKPARETGALVVCIVLLVLAIISCFVAAAAADGTLTNDSSSIAPPVGGNYAPGGVGAQGPSSGTVPNGGTTTTADPEAVGKRLIRNFPLYPGARRVASSKKYLPRGNPTSKYGKKYVVQRSANRVYNWYLKHLSRDHLEYYGGGASNVRDRDSGKVIDSYGTITSPTTQSLNGNFNIETGRRSGTCVLTVTLYG